MWCPASTGASDSSPIRSCDSNGPIPGVFENRPTQTVLNRDFGSPVERRVTERDGRVIIDTAALTIVYDQQPFSKEGLSVVVKGVADTQFNTWHYGDAQRGQPQRHRPHAGRGGRRHRA